MTMNEMVAEYNKLTGKNIKKFETKAIAEKRLEEARKIQKQEDALANHLSKNIDSLVERALKNRVTPEQAKTSQVPHVKRDIVYSPKQLEVELGKDQLAIRKKLRKLFPDKAKQGAWRITIEMLDQLRKVM